MGTRSLTFFHNQEKKPIVCMYGHFDGYLSEHGMELAKFINSKTLVNGISLDEDSVSNTCNGMECLAAMAVGHFKRDVTGSYYLYPTDTIDAWHEYEYHVYSDKVVVKKYDKVAFVGNWAEFLEECKETED